MADKSTVWRKWAAKNREHLREYKNRWRKTNVEARRRICRNSRYKTRYGITAAEFDLLVQAQQGLCAICEAQPAVVLDHNHVTGKRRQALCQSCNLGLGRFRDSSLLLKAAIAYLRKHENTQ